MKISRQKIELLQAQHGLSAREMAEKGGITQQLISNIKRRGTCSPKSVAMIAKSLGVSVEEILEEN